MLVEFSGKSELDGDEWLVSSVLHGLQVAGDTAVGLSVLLGSEPAQHFLFGNYVLNTRKGGKGRGKGGKSFSIYLINFNR